MNKTKKKQGSCKKISIKNHIGSSLIEVLVTLLIMAVGLLGLASIQMMSLKNVNNSQFRSLAIAYANDMAERIRANGSGVSAGGYDAIDTTSVSDPDCSACSAVDIAQMDGYQWALQISQAVKTGGLPNGTGTVIPNGSLFDITVSWEEQGRDSNGGTLANASFTLTMRP